MRATVTIPVLCNIFCVFAAVCFTGCQGHGFHNAVRSDNPEQRGGSIRIVLIGKRPPECHAYDMELVNAVGNRWKDLLSNKDASDSKPGKVVLVFKLHFDGQVTDLTTKETTLSRTLTLICQKAILDIAPYKHWPQEMHLMVGKDHREITFAFYYDEYPHGLLKTSDTTNE